MPDYIVRYGAMRFLGVFTANDGTQYLRGAKVIARTDRGLEAGEILCESSQDAVERLGDPTTGQILREMTPEDANELARIQDQARNELQVCQRYIEKLGLQMQLVDVEHIFGGERIVVYYLAESRVDFRELVRSLAGEFQTRIEMRQIGVRDEAKLRGLWKPGLLQQPPRANASGLHENGQVAEGHARSDQDLRAMRAAEVLPAIRVRDL